MRPASSGWKQDGEGRQQERECVAQVPGGDKDYQCDFPLKKRKNNVKRWRQRRGLCGIKSREADGTQQKKRSRRMLFFFQRSSISLRARIRGQGIGEAQQKRHNRRGTFESHVHIRGRGTGEAQQNTMSAKEAEPLLREHVQLQLTSSRGSGRSATLGCSMLWRRQ